jgi:signal transduction histidine kinase
VLRATTEYIRDRIRKRAELIPLGYSWSFVVLIDASCILVAVVSTLQRPSSDLLPALVAVLVALAPMVLFFVVGFKYSPGVLWATSTATTAIFLLATSTPIPGDFAPLFQVLMVGSVGSLATLYGGLLATGSAAGVLLAASAMDRLDNVTLYLSFVAMGWLIGYLMRVQQLLMIKQTQAQAALAEHAAADERRRIAREVHDVIAHSLSVTLLHVTAARRGLQQDRDVDDAVEALEDAERLGRQAMADIRRTVGLLDGAPMKVSPEPGVADIGRLVDDFSRAGLNVTMRTDGSTERVSSAVGLALYRITQESLANIAKHASHSKSLVVLVISRSNVKLVIVNELPVAVPAEHASEGRGLRGMRQRVELLGGVIDIGPVDSEWSVCADIPLGDSDAPRWPLGCGF